MDSKTIKGSEPLENINHENFCHLLIRHGNATKAYLSAYDQKRTEKSAISAKAQAWKVRNRPEVKERLMYLRKNAIDLVSIEMIAERVNDSMNSDILEYLDEDGTISVENLRALPIELRRLVSKFKRIERKIGEMESEIKFEIELVDKSFAMKAGFDIYKELKKYVDAENENAVPEGYEENDTVVHKFILHKPKNQEIELKTEKEQTKDEDENEDFFS